jgi:colicin import membrane protein
MTPEEQKQWQEDNLSDLDEDIQYDENGEPID